MLKVIKRNHNTYTIKQKKEIVEYAKKMERNKAVSHFELDTNMIERWIKVSLG